MLKINGVATATPKVFRVEIMDLDGESHRNARGDVLRDRIATKRKLNCEWGPLTNSQISIILKAVQGVFFAVEYPDPLTSEMRTGTFYVGDRSAPMYRFGNTLWEGLSMNFIER